MCKRCFWWTFKTMFCNHSGICSVFFFCLFRFVGYRKMNSFIPQHRCRPTIPLEGVWDVTVLTFNARFFFARSVLCIKTVVINQSFELSFSFKSVKYWVFNWSYFIYLSLDLGNVCFFSIWWKRKPLKRIVGWICKALFGNFVTLSRLKLF